MDPITRNQDLYLRSRDVPVIVESQIEQPWPYTGGAWVTDAQTGFDGSESNAFDCDIFTGFVPKTLDQQLIPGGPITTTTLAWPARLQAVHMNLIPRGVNRGKVMLWPGAVVFGTLGGAWRNGKEWSFQPWSIVDPTVAPMTAQHFLLPLAERERNGPASVTPVVGSQWFSTGAPHGFATGDRACVSTSGTMPAPFTVDTNYYVEVLTATTFRLQPQTYDADLILQPTGVPVVMVNAGTGTIRVTKDFLHTLFCAGQAWNHRGHLVVAGGTRYEISRQWRHNTYSHTWVWDPTATADLCYTAGGTNPGATPSGAVGPFANLERVDMGKVSGSPTHYESGYGRWIQGPDLTVARYYPTLVMTAPMTAGHGVHIGRTCGLVVGGDDNPSDNDPIGQINGTYESLVQNAAPTYASPGSASNHGLIKEDDGGVFSWPGPSDWNATTNPWPDGNPFEDGLFFFPHMHLLSSGKLFMAAFTHRSATLDHDANPGTWTLTEGHDDRPGLINAFRYYPSSTHVILDGTDVVLRMGGGQTPVLQTPVLPTLTIATVVGDTIFGTAGHSFTVAYPVTVTNVGGAPPGTLTVATTYFVIPVDASSLKLAATAADAIDGIAITPGGVGSGTNRICADTITNYGRSVFAPLLGGYRPTAWPELLLDTRTVDQITPAVAASQWTVGPAMNRARSLQNVVWLADGGQMAIGGVNVDDAVAANVPPAIHPLLMPMAAVGGGHMHEPDTGEVENGFVYHLTCELLRWRGTRWEALDWASAASRRDYHSTALLLPDARVLVAGGEGRAIDFELFEPPYLKPSTDHPDIEVTRPTTVQLDVALSDSTYPVAYANTYQVTCAALPAGQRIERVTLVTPGSATHHRDWSQQFYDLTVVATNDPSEVTVTMPPNAKHIRPGYAMLFAITNLGVPSEAVWILLP